MSIKNKKRLIILASSVVTVISLIFFMPGCVLWLQPLSDDIQEELENSLNYGLDGIVVYVNQGKNGRYYTAGWKNRENKVPSDPKALFKIASISKLYIAAAACKLVNEKRLALDATLASLLPELKDRIEYANQITLAMLLRHRSGIPNFTDQKGFPWDSPPKNNQETLAFVLDKAADFKPDKKYKYSNTNYLLIGEILDKTLGYSHNAYIRNEMLIPLGLVNTYGLLRDVNLDDVTSGYFVGYPDDTKFNDYTSPGGSMLATGEDVGIFLRALIDGTLLTDEEQAIYSSVYAYEHTGLLPGYQSIARYHPDIDAVVVQLVNTSGKNMWSRSETIYKRIVKILRRQK